MTFVSYDFPLGWWTFGIENGVIVSLSPGKCEKSETCPLSDKAADELDRYFRGMLEKFSVPIAPKGTAFQKNVWSSLCRIPYGETRSYASVAADAGHPSAVRAAANAVGRNPIPIILPCHRVIRTDGSIGGFSLGTELKRKLLQIEKIYL